MSDTTNMPEFEEQLLTVDPDVTSITKLGKQTIYNAINSGELRAVRFGRAVRVPASALREWMASDSAGAAMSTRATKAESITIRDHYFAAALTGELARGAPDEFLPSIIRRALRIADMALALREEVEP